MWTSTGVSGRDVRAVERRAETTTGRRDGGDAGVAGTAHGADQARAGEGGLGQPDLCGPQRVLGAEPVDRRAGGGAAAAHGPCGGLVRAEEGRADLPRTLPPLDFRSVPPKDKRSAAALILRSLLTFNIPSISKMVEVHYADCLRALPRIWRRRLPTVRSSPC